MIIDHDLMMSDDQDITASAATTDVIDLTKGGDAVGNELYFVVRVKDVFDSAADNGVLQIGIETDDAVGFGTKTVLMLTPQMAQTALTADTIILKTKLPPGLKRYVRGYFTVTTANFTAGSVDCFLTPDVPIR